MIRNRELVWAVITRSGGMWGIIGLSAWYYYFTYRLFGQTNAQILYLLLASAAVIGQIVGGITYDRYSRTKVVSLGMIIFGLALALITQFRNILCAYMLAPLIGFTAFFWKSGLDTYIVEIVDPSQRGSAAGFMNTISQVGSLIAPSAVGYAVDSTGALSPIPTLTLAIGPLAASVPMLAKTLQKRPKTKQALRPASKESFGNSV